MAQDLGTTYGKILRVEVSTDIDDYPGDSNKNFAIPEDNPYVSTPGALGEVLHSGLRNPWRASFDRATGDMYVGDVGWLTREEIDFVKDGQQGMDFGWSNREGTIEVPGGSSPDIGGPLGDSIDPIYEYNHSTGVSVAGGYAYRGPIQGIQGNYFFADSFSGRIWTAAFDRDIDAASFNGMNLTGVTEISADLQSVVDAGSITNIVSFGEDNAGNLYLVKIGDGGPAGSISGTGEIFRLMEPPLPQDIDDLILLVDTSTGGVQLRNQSGFDVTFDGYALRSESDSLDATNWQSFDDLDGPGNNDGGWRESNSSSGQLAELLQAGEFTLADEQVIHFGDIYNTTSGMEDLEFEYHPPGQSVGVDVRVIYGNIPENGDFNGDGRVDGLDFLMWQRDSGSTENLALWKATYGELTGIVSTANAADSVPEPTSALLYLLALSLNCIKSRIPRRHRRRHETPTK